MNTQGSRIKNFEDILGKEFGNLTPIEYLYSTEIINHKRDHYYNCKCICGNTFITKRRNLKRSEVLSCGCLKRQRNLNRIEEFKLNGEYTRNINSLYYHTRNNAKLRGYSFNLDKELYTKLILANCHYCGSPPSNKSNPKCSHKIMLYNGLDRKDNNIGYETNNIVTCCKICNMGKHNISYDEFKEYINRVAKFIISSEDI